MHQRTQDLPLRSHWADLAELATTLAQLGALFALMGLFAALVIGFG